MQQINLYAEYFKSTLKEAIENRKNTAYETDKDKSLKVPYYIIYTYKFLIISRINIDPRK